MILDSDFVALLFDLIGVFARLGNDDGDLSGSDLAGGECKSCGVDGEVQGWEVEEFCFFSLKWSGDSWIHGSWFCSIHE